MFISQSPAFNLKAVIKETGIAAGTLRAWERRYGLPQPERTPGGHRLYSQHDIETVKWLMARQTEGLSISRAVDLWNEQLASGSDPLAGAASEPTVAAPLAASSTNLESLRQNWITACFRYDTALADQILNQAFAANSVEIACTEILLRGLQEIGELWHRGIASVQQEHFASGVAMRRLEALISAAPPPSRPEAVITACPPDEQHAFPLTLLTLLLRRRGWNVIPLGANVPTERMEETIQAVKPRLVLLAAQTLMTAVTLREMARLLNRKKIPAAFGGRVFNSISMLHPRIPAHFLGNTIELSVPRIERLIVEAVPAPAEQPVRQEIDELASAYDLNRPRIELTLYEGLQSSGNTIEYLDTANHFTGNVISAALHLGDINYVTTDMTWLTSLLVQHKVPLAHLPEFLQRYLSATEKVMGESSQPISEWLKLEIEKLKAAKVF